MRCSAKSTLVGFLLFSAALRSYSQEVPQKLLTNLDTGLQQRFADFAKISINERVEQYRQAVAMAPQGGRSGYNRFIQNLAFYGATSQPRRGELAPAQVFQLIRKHLNFRNRDILIALVPIFDEDPLLREFIRREVFRPPPTVSRLDVRDLEAILTEEPSSQAVPDLVSCLFALDPQEALAILGRIHHFLPQKTRELIWSGHFISDVDWRIRNEFLQPGDMADATALLDRLSRDEQWWIRYYAGYMLVQQPEFRLPTILDRLRADNNEMVRVFVSVDFDSLRLSEPGPQEPRRPPPAVVMPGMRSRPSATTMANGSPLRNQVDLDHQAIDLTCAQYGLARGAGDSKLLAALFWCDDDKDGHFVAAEADRVIACYRLYVAGTSRWEEGAFRPILERLQLTTPDAYGMAMVEWRVRGEVAQPVGPLPEEIPSMRNIKGIWKIDVTPRAQGSPQRGAVAAARIAGEVAAVATKISSGSVNTPAEAEQLLQRVANPRRTTSTTVPGL
jgi:hypothetical protein